jgi:hypothetical protein
MIELFVPIVLALILFMLLLFAAAGSGRKNEYLLEGELERRRPGNSQGCPPELVHRLFSVEDGEFVAGLGSVALLRLFAAERKAVARQWVYQTSSEISNAMRAHTLRARGSADLRVGAELRLFARFVGLRLLCGLLIVLMIFVDLHVLAGLANRASGLAYAFRSSRPNLGESNTPAPSASFNRL